jgi:hypothetical protein
MFCRIKYLATVSASMSINVTAIVKGADIENETNLPIKLVSTDSKYRRLS